MDKSLIDGCRLFENPFWAEAREFSKHEAWTYLLLSAKTKDTKVVDGNKCVNVKRGQVYASVRFLSTKWGWSSKKTWKFLELLVANDMVTKETVKETGQTVVTICNYDSYTVVEAKGKQQRKQSGNSKGNGKETVKETGKSNVTVCEVDTCIDVENVLETPVEAKGKQQRKQSIYNITTNVDNININKISNANALATKEESPVGEACVCAKTWREDFEVYKQELKTAYGELVNDRAFIEERQKYCPGVDIRLSMEKAYIDYWSTEAGWKKKKAARSKGLDWKRTFVNALDLRSNRVYQSSGNKSPYQPITENQKRFTDYLQKHAPLMLNIPIQPTDEEIEELRKYPNGSLLSAVTDINNNRYLTNGRNSVYQTILEFMAKKSQDV